MQQEDLELLLQRQPCPLVRIHVAGGQVYEINDPDEAFVTRSTVQLLLPKANGKGREAIISLLHVVWVEVLSS